MSQSRSTPFLITVVALLAVVMTLAVLFGYISVDSWYYMLLAQALRHGQGCSLQGEYLAIYPCGYPAVLALTTPSSDPSVLMITSKIANLLLLSGAFWFVWRASRHLFMAALVVLNPVTLTIALYTWSENLLLFCTCGVVFALSRIHAGPRRKAPFFLLAAFLIAGCFARYFFGPFAFLLFGCAWLAYGKQTAIRAFPSFAVAGLVCVAYQAFNLHVTGFATGMPRVAAPEAPLLLIRQFAIALGANGLGVVVAAALLTGISFRQLSFGPPGIWGLQKPAGAFSGEVAAGSAEKNATRQTSLFILAAGLSFLALALILRLRTLFDPYNTRTIGYGIVLTIAGLVGLFVHTRQRDASLSEARRRDTVWPIAALCACTAFAVVYCDDGALTQSIGDAFDDYAFPAASLAALKSTAPAADVVVFFQLPVTGLETGDVDNIAEVYYGKDVITVSPMQGPDNPPETPASFLHRVDDAGSRNCFFDFTPFATPQDFETYLTGTTLIDRRLKGLTGPWQEVNRRNMAPAMQTYLRRIFQPKRRVPCQEILALPPSRDARAGAP